MQYCIRRIVRYVYVTVHSSLEILRCMQLQQRSAVVDNAIERLLNCNLSSKYALTGKLCMSWVLCHFVFIHYSASLFVYLPKCYTEYECLATYFDWQSDVYTVYGVTCKKQTWSSRDLSLGLETRFYKSWSWSWSWSWISKSWIQVW